MVDSSVVSPSRRRFLALASSVAGLAGCLDQRSETPTSSDATETSTASPTESTTPSASATEPLVYPLYVVNGGEADRCVRLSLHEVDSSTVVSGTYRVVASDVLEFSGATTVGTRYEIDVELSDGRSLNRRWTPERCLDSAGGRDASKAGYVRFDADSLFFAENGCDAVSSFLQRPKRVDPERDDCSV